MCGGQKFSAFQVDCLDAHNDYRSRHGSARLELNDGLCKYAEDHAKYLCGCGAVKPSKGPYGENIFMKSASKKVYPDAIEAVEQWYSELEKSKCAIDYPSRDNKHFAQVVWKGTRLLGVGFATSPDSKKLIVVANYYPPGNDFDTFGENVKPPRNTTNECPPKIKVV